MDTGVPATFPCANELKLVHPLSKSPVGDAPSLQAQPPLEAGAWGWVSLLFIPWAPAVIWGTWAF